MVSNKEQKHQIEFIFPVFVFFFFTLSAIVIILFAARVYQATVSKATMTYNANTSLAYIREKMHQHKDENAISVTAIGGHSALKLTETIADEEYVTYIYAYDGSLRELFMKSGSEDTIPPSSGSVILPVLAFDIEIVNDNLLYFSCTDSDGQTSNAYVGIF